MTTSDRQWMRQASLKVVGPTKTLDLSEMHFKFLISQSSEENPNTASIRIYNLSSDTVKSITGNTPVEFTLVELKAGYINSGAGTIFAGTIKQFRRGRENATDTYLDILAAADDIEYNFGTVNASITKDTPKRAILDEVIKEAGLKPGYIPPGTGGTLPRGKVLWGMGRTIFRNFAASEQWGWSIQNGKLEMIPLDSYKPGDIVELNSATGMIGIPEQTDAGIRVRCLLNPKLYIGGRVHIDNASINQTSQAGENDLPVGQIPYDQWAGVTLPADVSSDGYYMTYVIEHRGDTRGREWYSDIIGLALSSKEGKVSIGPS